MLHVFRNAGMNNHSIRGFTKQKTSSISARTEFLWMHSTTRSH
jgi:hypothetical protein